MLKNGILLAFRTLWKQKHQTAILVSGLALGLATCFLISIWIKSELSYDRFHVSGDRIFRIVEKVELDGSGEFCASAPVDLGPTVLRDLPHLVEKQTRFMQLRATSYLLENGAERRFNETKLYFADPSALDMFSFNLKKGDPATALLAPNTVVLTEAAAKKYFPENTDPLGQTLRFEGNRDLLVTGIAADVPNESHLHFEVLVSFASLETMLTKQEKKGFYWNPAWTYVQLRENVQPAQLSDALPGIVQKYFPQVIRAGTTLPIQALSDIHLQSHGLVGELEPNGSYLYIRVFSAVAFFVLLLAVINFINLSIAQSIHRVKEIGLRKTLGAGRGSLIGQMLSEAVLTAFFSGILGLVLVVVALPFFNGLTGKNFEVADVLRSGGWFAVGTLVTGLLAGLYPAFYLSGFRPALAVKGIFDRQATRSRTQQVLVVAQFSVSVALIIGSLIANRQFNYLREARLGYDREDVLILPASRCALQSIDKFDDFRRQLLQNNAIQQVTALEEPLGIRFNTGSYRPEGMQTDKQFGRLYVRDGFLETFGIELLAGRSFSPNYLADSTSVIVNEAMLRHLGWGSPENALQKSLGGSRVVGVARDFHFASLHTAIDPIVLHIPRNDRQNGFFVQYMAVRIAPGATGEAILFLKKTWETMVPDRAFEYSFLDDEHAKLYQSEARLGSIAMIFNGLNILIACMGLVGLATFVIARRTKEIGVRKVLGASVASVVSLLSKDFLKLVIIAIFIATPVAFYFMKKWLAGFAYRIEISWWMFIAAGAAAVGIAFLTISFQSVQAALANPVKSLKSE